jgi:hypothetical protein
MTYFTRRERRLPFPTCRNQIIHPSNRLLILLECKFWAGRIITIFFPFYTIIADVFLYLLQLVFITNNSIIEALLPDGYAENTPQFIYPCCRGGFEGANDVAQGFQFCSVYRVRQLPDPINVIIFPCSRMKPIGTFACDLNNTMNVVWHHNELT